MYEKRQAKRVEHEHGISIAVMSKGKLRHQPAVTYNLTKDISASGARVQTNVFLPVDTLLKIQLTLQKSARIVTAIGRVRWVKSVYADELFEAGIEFVDTPEESVQALCQYIEAEGAAPPSKVAKTVVAKKGPGKRT